MSGGLIPAHEGSGRLTVDREALVERWVENFGLSGEWELRIAQQEAEHVAGLVESAVAVEQERLVSLPAARPIPDFRAEGVER